MAFRSIHQLRQLRIRPNPLRHFLSQRIASSFDEVFGLTIGCRFRDYSDAAPSPKVKASTSGKPTIADNAEVDGNVNRSSLKSSVIEPELLKFSAIADTWWDAEGPFKPLHALNPARLAFIRSTLCGHFGKDPFSARPFEGLRFVDVGCGGGILSEGDIAMNVSILQSLARPGFLDKKAAANRRPLARMGASVTGIDAVEKNIKIANLHAKLDPSTSAIEYQCTTAENLVEQQRQFDAVIASEVIEHVADPAEFCKSLAALAVPNGAIVISTINRSMRSYAAAIVAAEYLLQWVPKGTHEWSKFLTPEELVLILNRASVSLKEMAGFVYNPVTGTWSVSDDISVNFIAFATKSSTE